MFVNKQLRHQLWVSVTPPVVVMSILAIIMNAWLKVDICKAYAFLMAAEGFTPFFYQLFPQVNKEHKAAVIIRYIVLTGLPFALSGPLGMFISIMMLYLMAAVDVK